MFSTRSSTWQMNYCTVGTKLWLSLRRAWGGCGGWALPEQRCRQEGQRESAPGGWFGTWLLASCESAPVDLMQSSCPLSMNIKFSVHEKNSSFSSRLGFSRVLCASPRLGGVWIAQTQFNNTLSRPQNPHFACQNSAPRISLLFVPRLDLPRDQW